MNFKLSAIQLNAILQLFQSICGDHARPPQNFEAKLMLAVLSGIYRQLHKKSVDKKKKYTVLLSEQEALAFWIFFNKQHIIPNEAVYEANLIDFMCNRIHQKYAT